MPLILHGSARLPNYQIVLIVACELGLEIERVEVDFMKGEHKSGAYLQHQPFGQVPWFEDTDAGIEMFESRAICRYLVAKCRADHLMPMPDSTGYLQKLAKFETAAAIESCTWAPLVGAIVREGIFRKPFGYGGPDPATMKKLADDLGRKLDGYEAILKKQPYLAGDAFCLIDLLHFPATKYLFRLGLGELIESRPNVTRWWRSFAERESCTTVWTELDVDAVMDEMASA